jgi:hypothetical protein
VALLNKGFFSDQRHPARRLIDLIANAVRGWGPRDQDTLMKAIRSTVDSVNAGFEDDTSVFAAQIERLETILHGADRRARDKVSSLVHKLEQRDRQVVADANVSDQIARRRAGLPVPAAIDAFIDGTWREVLRSVYIQEGENSAAWQQALTTLDELLWSLQPKTDPAARRKLMATLPDLLQRLAGGMERVRRGDEWDDFLGQLMPLHMAAIKPSRTAPAADRDETRPDSVAAEGTSGASGTEPAAVPGAEAETKRLPESETAETAAERQDAPAPAPPPPPPSAEEEAAERLAVGDWVAFRFDDKPEISLRACWISRYGGLCLFADRPGEHARVLTRKQLARSLRDGTARLLSSAPLTDRAVAKLLIDAAPRQEDTTSSTE